MARNTSSKKLEQLKKARATHIARTLKKRLDCAHRAAALPSIKHKQKSQAGTLPSPLASSSVPQSTRSSPVAELPTPPRSISYPKSHSNSPSPSPSPSPTRSQSSTRETLSSPDTLYTPQHTADLNWPFNNSHTRRSSCSSLNGATAQLCPTSELQPEELESIEYAAPHRSVRVKRWRVESWHGDDNVLREADVMEQRMLDMVLWPRLGAAATTRIENEECAERVELVLETYMDEIVIESILGGGVKSASESEVEQDTKAQTPEGRSSTRSPSLAAQQLIHEAAETRSLFFLKHGGPSPRFLRGLPLPLSGDEATDIDAFTHQISSIDHHVQRQPREASVLSLPDQDSFEHHMLPTEPEPERELKPQCPLDTLVSTFLDSEFVGSKIPFVVNEDSRASSLRFPPFSISPSPLPPLSVTNTPTTTLLSTPTISSSSSSSSSSTPKLVPSVIIYSDHYPPRPPRWCWRKIDFGTNTVPEFKKQTADWERPGDDVGQEMIDTLRRGFGKEKPREGAWCRGRRSGSGVGGWRAKTGGRPRGGPRPKGGRAWYVNRATMK